ncbi:MFS general substrate transporter, partial [Aspergillus ellipticus CBS 707.79]
PQTIVSTALPEIVAHFKASDGAYTWIASSYLLANASLVPLWGRISDICGRKPIVVISVVLFLAGSLICGLAQNVAMIIAGRTIQGGGSGGITVMANICVSDLFDVRRRSAYLGIFGATWAIAGAIGPIIGGAFTTYSTWRWCFFINLPIGALSLLALLLFLTLPRIASQVPLLTSLTQIDYAGLILIILGTLLLLIGLECGGSTYPWRSATTITLLILGPLLIALFLYHQTRTPHPILPPTLFTSPQNLILLTITFAHSLVFIAGCFYLPIYFQNILGASALMSGVYLLPLVLALATSSGLAGFVLRKTGKCKPAIVFGMVFTAIGYALFTDLKPYASWGRVIGFQILAGMGIGPNFQATLVALQGNVRKTEVGRCTAGFSFVRQMAAAVGVVLGEVVYGAGVGGQIGVLRAAVGETLAAEVVQAATAVEGILAELGTAEKRVVLGVLVGALKWVWVLFAGAAGVGVLVALGLRDRGLGEGKEAGVEGVEGVEMRIEKVEDHGQDN